MSGLALYYDFKNSGADTLAGYLVQMSVKELISGELRSTVIETYRDVEMGVMGTLDKLEDLDLPNTSKKEIMLECFLFMEECEKYLHPEYPHSNFSYISSDKFKGLYDIAKVYVDDLALTYNKLDKNMKHLTREYYSRKVILAKNIINKVESLCHM